MYTRDRGVMIMIDDKKKYNRTEKIFCRLNKIELDRLEYIKDKLEVRDIPKTIRVLVDEKYSDLTSKITDGKKNRDQQIVVRLNDKEFEMLDYLKDIFNHETTSSTVRLLVKKIWESVKSKLKETKKDKVLKKEKTYRNEFSIEKYKQYDRHLERMKNTNIAVSREEITDPDEIRKLVKGNTKRILEYIFTNRIEGRFIGKTLEIAEAVGLKNESTRANLTKLEKYKLINRKLNYNNLHLKPRREIFITAKAIDIFGLKTQLKCD